MQAIRRAHVAETRCTTPGPLRSAWAPRRAPALRLAAKASAARSRLRAWVARSAAARASASRPVAAAYAGVTPEQRQAAATAPTKAMGLRRAWARVALRARHF